jgi:hypothetical protein
VFVSFDERVVINQVVLPPNSVNIEEEKRKMVEIKRRII